MVYLFSYQRQLLRFTYKKMRLSNSRKCHTAENKSVQEQCIYMYIDNYLHSNVEGSLCGNTASVELNYSKMNYDLGTISYSYFGNH